MASKDPIYLDFASATPMSDCAVDAMQPYLQANFYNPSALYLAAKNVHHHIDDARARAAKLLEVRPSEIIFTAGSTEANMIVVRGVMGKYKDSHMIVSSIEHDSVLRTAEDYPHSELPVDAEGIVKIKELTKLIQDTTVLISCMSVNNEIGSVQPIQEIAAVIAEIRQDRQKRGIENPIYLHVDASQSYSYATFMPRKVGADFVVISGSKNYGPKQTALLYIRAGVQLKPIITGGGQEYGVRSGTENVAGIMGLCAALEEASTLRSGEQNRLKNLREYCVSELLALDDRIHINGPKKHVSVHILHFTIVGLDNELIVMQLDEHGIMVATGSACSASSDEPSHVLHAMGFSDTEARSSIRISFGRTTTKQHIDYLISTLAKLLHR